MEKKDTLTKTLAIAGTMLIWFPLLVPVILTSIYYLTEQVFLFDYLMPAELFPVGLLGGVLLIWATRRAQFQQRLIGWGLGIAIGSLVLGQALAVLTGLATGEMGPAGLWYVIVIASLAIYSLAMVAAGVGGIKLMKHLFKTSQPTPLEGA